MRKKRGSIHFEMIISFIFFTGFLLFLFLTIKPYDTTTLPKSAVNGIYNNFIEETKTNFSEFTVIVDTDKMGPAGGCFEISIESIKFEPGNPVAYFGGEKVLTDRRGGSAKKIEIENKIGDEPYTIRMSPSVSPTDDLTGCNPLQEGDFKIGALYERIVTSKDAILAIKAEYENDYGALKEIMGVPEIFDFAITSTDAPWITMESFIPTSEEVFAEERVVEIVDQEGQINNVRVVFKLW